MKISGIVVGVVPDRFDEAIAALEQLEGVEVHQRDRATARVVVTQDAPTEAAHEQGVQRIQALPQVRYAQLVYHYAGDEADEVGTGGRAEEIE